MSVVKDIFKAYKASGYRDVEFDSMLSSAKGALGLSEDEVIGMLAEAWDSGALKNLESYASFAPPVESGEMLLFKKANPGTPEFDYVEALLDSLDSAVAAKNAQDVQDLTKKIDAVAKSSNTEYKKALFDIIESKRSPTETIDDMPIMRGISGASGDTFDSIKAIHEYGTTRGFAVPGAASAYVPRLGSVNEVADIAKELKKPSPDPRAIERFKNISEAKVGLWGKDADAARQLARDFNENEMRGLLSKLGLPPDQEMKLLNNFLENKGSRMTKLLEREKGVLGALTKIFSKNKGVSALEKFKAGGTLLGAPARAFLWMPKMLWKLKGFPVLGPIAGILAGLGQTAAAGYIGLKTFFGDDDKPDVSAPVEAPAGNGSVPGSIADPALAGNLHQKMRTILKRTFGPR
jgi:hypothetical protein